MVLTSPRYKARMLLEVQNPSGSLAKNEAVETSEIGIQTQVVLLNSGSFLKRAIDRVQTDTVPLVAPGTDLFSRLRQRIHPTTQDPAEAYKVGLRTALSSFALLLVAADHDDGCAHLRQPLRCRFAYP